METSVWLFWNLRAAETGQDRNSDSKDTTRVSLRAAEPRLVRVGRCFHLSMDSRECGLECPSLVPQYIQHQERWGKRLVAKGGGGVKICFRHVKSDFNTYFAWLKPTFNTVTNNSTPFQKWIKMLLPFDWEEILKFSAKIYPAMMFGVCLVFILSCACPDDWGTLGKSLPLSWIS